VSHPDIAILEARLGYSFCDRTLLERALCHTSYINENPGERGTSNERLEFLGDAVVELGVTTLIYNECDRFSEGKMTALRAKLVRTESLAHIARKIGLGEFLKLGKGADRSGERENDTVLENAFEAVMGAVFLDGTAAAARRVIREIFLPELEEQIDGQEVTGDIYDYKTRLQIELQRGGAARIHYKIVSESGPDHDKTFRVRVEGGSFSGEGEGKTKKAAEQNAAKAALESIV